MDERDPKTPDEEEIVRRLLESAGPRPPIPQDDLDAISSAARLAWKRQVRQQAAPPPARRPLRPLWTALAAMLAVAAGLAVWWISRLDREPPHVAWIEAVTGSVHLEPEADEPRLIAAGQPVALGASLRSDARQGRASLLVADGATVRLDVDTRVRFVSSTVLELERGALYIDTGDRRRPGAKLEIRTPVGTVWNLGTRFAVRVVDPESLLVRVRDGVVVAEQRGHTFRTQAGQELVLRRDGPPERRAALPYGPGWDWVMEASAGFDIEGRSLLSFLGWVSRETGWRIVFADDELAESSPRIILHGGMGKLRADQAPFAVLPGAGLEGEVKDGALIVRPRAPR